MIHDLEEYVKIEQKIKKMYGRVLRDNLLEEDSKKHGKDWH